MSNAIKIHLAKTGKVTDSHGRATTIDAGLLAELAEGYDVAVHKAPLVLGHPADGAPAYGWVDSLEVGADGELYGKVGEVAADLTDAVRDGRYRNVSISFWPKGHGQSPNPARATLRHVGVLGAQIPAIKGLTPLSFAEMPGLITLTSKESGGHTIDLGEPKIGMGFHAVRDFMRNMREWIIAQFGTEEADRVAPSWLIDTADSAIPDPSNFSAPPAPTPTPEEVPAMPDPEKPAELAEREAEVADLKRQLAERDARDKAAAAERLKTEAVEFADGLIDGGKLAPAGKPAIVELYRLAAGAEKAIELSDGATQPVLDAVKKLFDGANPVVDLSERTAPDGNEPLDAADGRALSKRAHAIQKEEPALSFAEALRKAEGEARDAA